MSATKSKCQSMKFREYFCTSKITFSKELHHKMDYICSVTKAVLNDRIHGKYLNNGRNHFELVCFKLELTYHHAPYVHCTLRQLLCAVWMKCHRYQLYH